MRLLPLVAGLVAQVPEPPVRTSMTWEAPETCPDREALVAAIEARLGRRPGGEEVEVAGKISGQPRRGFRLQLEIVAHGRVERRTLSSERCAALVDATALLVALAVDEGAIGEPGARVTAGVTEEKSPAAEADARPTGAEPIEAPAPDGALAPIEGPAFEPEVEPAPTRDVWQAPAPERRPPGPGGFVRVHGGAELGAMPDVTGMVGLAAGALWRRARLEVHGVYLAPQTARRGETSLGVSLLAAGAQGCARLRAGAVEFPLCGGLEFGGMRGIARGPGARTRTGLWLAGVASAGAAWHVHPRVTLSLAVHAVVRLVWPRFELRAPGPSVPVFEPAPIAGRLLAGLELRFGDSW